MALMDQLSGSLSGMLRGNYGPSDPSYKFRFDESMRGAERGLSKMRGSGNALTALLDRASGMASTEYGADFARKAGLLGQEQANSVAVEGNRLTGVRDANNFSLGNRQADNTATGNWLNYGLGMTNAANNRRQGDQQFGLGMFNGSNNFTLGQQRNQNDWYQGWANANSNWLNANTNADNNRNTWNMNWWRQFA